MDRDLQKILVDGATELGVTLGNGAVEAFSVYFDELKAWNRKINLTSVDSDREIVVKHFLDSLVPCAYLKGGEKILDVGAGGGFPGLPIKIAMPGVEVTLVDSVGKKVHFMRHVIRRLALTGAEAISARVEDRRFVASSAGKYDCVISRAFTELSGFVDLALPYLAPCGRVVAMKGPRAAEEVASLGSRTGLSEPEVHEVAVPFSERTTTIVIIEKV